MVSPLKARPLEYRIGGPRAKSHPNAIVEVGYDTLAGPDDIGYCNQFDENSSGAFGPYLDQTGTASKYDELVPDPKSGGFLANLKAQFAKRKATGCKLVELDNPDAYSVADNIRAIDLAVSYGFQVVAKNPLAIEGDPLEYVKHPAVVGIIQENDDDVTVAKLHALRVRAGKPELPIRIVAFEDDEGGQAFAERMAASSKNYTDVGVTFDSASNEYGGEIEHLALPKVSGMAEPTNPEPTDPEVTGADILAKARSYIGKFRDGSDVPMLAMMVAKAFPDMRMEDYAKLANNSTAWCAIFVFFILSQFGIRPPYDLPYDETDDWMFARSPVNAKWGAVIPRAQAQPGDLAVLSSHITFFDGDAGDGYFWGVGGNQSDTVTRARFAWSDATIVRPPGASVQPGPLPVTERPEIQQGSIGDAVEELQRLLGGLDIDGEFGPLTEAAVIAYQKAHGLEVDGVVGPETWGSLLGKKPPAPTPTPVPTGNRFEVCVKRLLVHEGGNDDDPRDPGGRTSRGILQREWDTWRNTHPGLPADVWQAPQDQVLAIYKEKYWDAMQCDRLPVGVDYAVFDFGVNSGISRSAKFLQTRIGAVVDGAIGDDTIAKTAQINPATLVNQLCDDRLAFLRGLGTWATFGNGWSNRVRDVRRDALADAAAAPLKPSQPPEPIPVPEPLPPVPEPLPEPQPRPVVPIPVPHVSVWPAILQALSPALSAGWAAAYPELVKALPQIVPLLGQQFSGAPVAPKPKMTGIIPSILGIVATYFAYRNGIVSPDEALVLGGSAATSATMAAGGGFDKALTWASTLRKPQ